LREGTKEHAKIFVGKPDKWTGGNDFSPVEEFLIMLWQKQPHLGMHDLLKEEACAPSGSEAVAIMNAFLVCMVKDRGRDIASKQDKVYRGQWLPQRPKTGDVVSQSWMATTTELQVAQKHVRKLKNPYGRHARQVILQIETRGLRGMEWPKGLIDEKEIVCLPGELLYVTSVSDGEPFMTVSVRVLLPGDPLPTGWFQGLQAITGGFSADDADEPCTPSKRLNGKQSPVQSPGSSRVITEREGQSSTSGRRRITRKKTMPIQVQEDVTSASQQDDAKNPDAACKKPRPNLLAKQAPGSTAELREKAARESEAAVPMGISVFDTRAVPWQEETPPLKKARQQEPVVKAADDRSGSEAGVMYAVPDSEAVNAGNRIADEVGLNVDQCQHEGTLLPDPKPVYPRHSCSICKVGMSHGSGSNINGSLYCSLACVNKALPKKSEQKALPLTAESQKDNMIIEPEEDSVDWTPRGSGAMSSDQPHAVKGRVAAVASSRRPTVAVFARAAASDTSRRPTVAVFARAAASDTRRASSGTTDEPVPEELGESDTAAVINSDVGGSNGCAGQEDEPESAVPQLMDQGVAPPARGYSQVEPAWEVRRSERLAKARRRMQGENRI